MVSSIARSMRGVRFHRRLCPFFFLGILPELAALDERHRVDLAPPAPRLPVADVGDERRVLGLRFELRRMIDADREGTLASDALLEGGLGLERVSEHCSPRDDRDLGLSLALEGVRARDV